MNKKAIFIIILIFNLVLLSLFFPPAKVINNDPISSVDYPIHYYKYSNFQNSQINIISSFFTINDLKFLSAVLFLFPKMIVFKGYIFLFLLTIPIIFYAGSKICFNNEKAALTSMFFSSFIFFYSFFVKQRLQSGLFPFLFSTSLIFLSCCFYYRDGLKTKKGLFFLLWSLLIHPFAIIYFLIFTSIRFWKKKIIGLGSIALLFLIAIAQYFILRFDTYFHQSKGLMGITDIIFYPIFFFTVILTVYSLTKIKKRQFWIALLISTFIFSHFIGYLRIFHYLQPQRAMYFLFFFTIILAPLKIKKAREILIATIIIILLIITNQGPLVASSEHVLEFGIHPDLIEIKDTLKDPSLIWVECSTFKTDLIYGGHSDYLFLTWFGREKVKLSYITNYPEKYQPHYCDGEINGISITENKEVDEIIVNNNISHIVIWSNTSREYFDNEVCFTDLCIVDKTI